MILLAPLLLAVPAVPQSKAPAHPLELHTSPLVELWLDVRRLSEADGLPEDDALAAAVEAMRALGQSLGQVPGAGFGLVEGNLEGAEDAEELALAFEDLPEVWRSRSGAQVVLREPCLAVAAAVAVIEPSWRDTEWPAREAALIEAQAELTKTLDAHGAAIYGRLHETLGLTVEGARIPVYLVTQAPWPGAFTLRRHGGGGISFVAIEEDLPSFTEAVVHESIHALDIGTPGPESLLTELRQELAAAGLDARAARDWPHTLFFFAAGDCVRTFVDPAHVDYGDRTTLYARSQPAADLERPLWKAYVAGKLGRPELVAAILTAATEDEE